MLRSTLRSLVIAGLCVGCTSSTSLAQEESASEDVMEIQMAVEDDSGAGPVVISSSRMMFAGEDPESGQSSFQIFTGGDLGMDGWMPGGAGTIDPISLLSNESVREELELVGDQLDKFQTTQKELQDEISEKAKSLAGGKLNPSEMGEIAKEIAELQKGRQDKLESMLLPHQLDRLKQVALQIQMKKRGTGNTLLSKEMTEELGIDAAQKKRIKERQEELKKELAERMEELKEEIRGKLLDELTSEQKAKLEDLSGDSFEYKPTDFRQQIKEKLNNRIRKRIGG